MNGYHGFALLPPVSSYKCWKKNIISVKEQRGFLQPPSHSGSISIAIVSWSGERWYPSFFYWALWTPSERRRDSIDRSFINRELEKQELETSLYMAKEPDKQKLGRTDTAKGLCSGNWWLWRGFTNNLNHAFEHCHVLLQVKHFDAMPMQWPWSNGNGAPCVVG